MHPPSSTLQALFHPKSVAIIGASSNPQKISGRSLHYTKLNNYPGHLYPVNPNRPEVQGVPTVPSIRDVPEPVDLAFMAVPAAQVLAEAEACAAVGVKSLIVFSSGFAETSAEGVAMQLRLAAIGREAGMRIVGPNCMGVLNIGLGLFGTFTTAFEHGYPKVGGAGFVSQSGAFGAHGMVLARERGLGLSLWITTGNECDVDTADCLDFLADDENTRVILAYMEGAKDAARLGVALEKCRLARKPVVMLKVGRTELGARAAASHTASLAGSDAVWDAFFADYGVVRADSIHELIEIAYAGAAGIYPPGRKVGLVTISGGVGVVMADAAIEAGLEVPEMPQEAQRRLLELVPFAAPRNPVDTTAAALDNMGLMAQNLEVMLNEGGCDAVLLFLASVGLNERLMGQLTQALLDLRKQYPEALVLITTLVRPDLKAQLEAEGFLIVDDPSWGIRQVAALVQFAEAFARAPLTPPPALPAGPALSPGALDEYAASEVLRAAGLPMAPLKKVASADAAAEAAQALGFPVVLKVASPDILHKSDAGGVLLHLADAEAVRQGYTDMLARVRQAHPQARIEGAVVAPMAPAGVELILGVKRDPVFGPVVLCGLGGVFVEVMKDVALRIAPFDEAAALKMLRSLKGWPLLAGARGQAPADVAALARTLSGLSRFAAAHAADLETLDLNPVRVFPEGQGVLALDALLVGREPGAA